MHCCNPQDRAYSVPQLFEFIERGQLAFGRWVRQAPYLPQCGDMAKLPHAARGGASCRRRIGIAAAELFRGTMTRHSVLVYRECPSGLIRNRSHFDGQALGRTTFPIRRLETIRVARESACRGSSGPHQPDAHGPGPVSARSTHAEKRMFDAIDGKRRIEQDRDEAGCRTSPYDGRLEVAHNLLRTALVV